jgi:hypothetical protein
VRRQFTSTRTAGGERTAEKWYSALNQPRSDCRCLWHPTRITLRSLTNLSRASDVQAVFGSGGVSRLASAEGARDAWRLPECKAADDWATSGSRVHGDGCPVEGGAGGHHHRGKGSVAVLTLVPHGAAASTRTQQRQSASQPHVGTARRDRRDQPAARIVKPRAPVSAELEGYRTRGRSDGDACSATPRCRAWSHRRPPSARCGAPPRTPDNRTQGRCTSYRTGAARADRAGDRPPLASGRQQHPCSSSITSITSIARVAAEPARGLPDTHEIPPRTPTSTVSPTSRRKLLAEIVSVTSIGARGGRSPRR